MYQTMSLHQLAQTYFSRKYQYNVPETPVKGRSGQKWNFDGLITFKDQKFGVFVRQWDRSIGVNQIRQLEKACRDTKCAGGIIVGEIFSSNAEVFGENLGIQVVDRGTLISKLESGI